MKNVVTLSIALFMASSLAACSSIDVSQDATMVRLTHNEPSIKECHFLGDVTGSQGDFFVGAFTSNENLETGARNDIKNKAKALGGNVVYLLTERAGQTGSVGGIDGNVSGGSQQTNVTLSGNVYYCPVS
ncbi:DUF4156 domain-containing protein [Colwellia sp. D2M02]|nr:DUF4156 domain-containing protein [Colwellia sp. D2M02]